MPGKEGACEGRKNAYLSEAIAVTAKAQRARTRANKLLWERLMLGGGVRKQLSKASEGTSRGLEAKSGRSSAGFWAVPKKKNTVPGLQNAVQEVLTPRTGYYAKERKRKIGQLREARAGKRGRGENMVAWQARAWRRGVVASRYEPASRGQSRMASLFLRKSR